MQLKPHQLKRQQHQHKLFKAQPRLQQRTHKHKRLHYKQASRLMQLKRQQHQRKLFKAQLLLQRQIHKPKLFRHKLA